MIAQPSPKAESEGDSVRPVLGTYFLRALLVLSLIYYAALMVDLVLNPRADFLEGELISAT